MHYDPLRLGPCPKDLSEWTSLPPPQHAPHTTTQQAQQLVPHTRIRVPFPLPRHNIRPAQMMKTIRLMLKLVLMLVVSPLPLTTVLLSAFLHGSHLTPSHTNMLVCPSPRPALNDPTTTSGRRTQIIHCLIFAIVADIQPSTKYKYMF